MQNGSASAVASAPAALPYNENPEHDFRAAPVSPSLGTRHTGVLSTMPVGTHVAIEGVIDLVRIYGNENDANVLPAAAVLLNSRSGAMTVLAVDQRHYCRTWGHLVHGNTVRVVGKVRRPEPTAPVIVDVVRVSVTRKAGV